MSEEFETLHKMALAKSIEVVAVLSDDRGSKTAATLLDVSLFGERLLEI